MKKLLFLICAFLGFHAQAQTPNFNYQGVARNTSGAALQNQNVSLRLSILDGTATGPVLYQETHGVITNSSGLFHVLIGNGTVVSGDLTTINWMGGDRFLQVEMDAAGGSSFTDLGAKKLAAVPYAAHSTQAEYLYMFGSGTTNPDKMIIRHSPAFPGWGLGYRDGADEMVFTATNGATGISINLDAQTITIPGGSPATGKVLTAADASGLAEWTDRSTKVYSMLPPGCQRVVSVTPTFAKISDLGTFTKANSASHIEVDFHTVLWVATMASPGVVYELRIDNLAPATGRSGTLIRDNDYYSVAMKGIFTGISAGLHTVSIWVRSINGTATDAYYDPGCFNSYNVNGVYVKEFH